MIDDVIFTDDGVIVAVVAATLVVVVVSFDLYVCLTLWLMLLCCGNRNTDLSLASHDCVSFVERLLPKQSADQEFMVRTSVLIDDDQLCTCRR